jgi:hypothetical protein
MDLRKYLTTFLPPEEEMDRSTIKNYTKQILQVHFSDRNIFAAFQIGVRFFVHIQGQILSGGSYSVRFCYLAEL